MPGATSLTLLAVAALVLVGGGLAYWFRRRSRLRREASTAYHHFRCPNCGRRLRFQARQEGHKGACSHCGSPVTFPSVSQSID
jgi:predicted RNA-binding Zn-ribbon protein involved in translation (DUF1610 family)